MRRGAKNSIARRAIVVALCIPQPVWANSSTSLGASDSPIITAPPVLSDRLNTSQQDIELVVPLRDIGPLGQVTIRIAPDDSLRVKGDDLIRLLERRVRPGTLAPLSAAIDADGFISAQAAGAAGFNLVFDTSLLELAVEIPAESRQIQSLGFSLSEETLIAQPTDEPEPFSAYLNYRASLDYLHVASSGLDEGFRDPRIELDFAGNIGRVAFENFFTIDGNQDEAFSRNASRLIYDDVDRAMRWTGGDLIPDGTAFQSVPDIAGIGVARNYSLNYNDRFLTSRSSQTITLREQSRVEVRINGAVSRTLTLPPGTYDLRDLPLTQGANAVEVIIESPGGAREVVVFDFFSDSTLLAVGVDEFSANVGIRSSREESQIEYLTDEPIFSGYYRRGLSSQLTAGANLQATRDAVLAGAEAVYGSSWGLTAVDFGLSQRDGQGSGAALRVRHRYSRSLDDLPGAEIINVSLEARTADFGPIQSLGAVTNYPLQIAGRYSRPINRRLTLGIGGDYAVGDGQLEERYGVSLNGTYQYDFNTNIDFGANYGSAGLFGEEANVFVNFTRRFGARSTISAGLESQNGLMRVGYSRTPEATLDAWSWNANLSRTNDAIGFNGSAFYVTNRGEAELTHDTTFDRDGEIAQQQTSARVYGAVGYAGGRVGIGRRVYDSFALVRPHPTLRPRPVLIRGERSLEESARSGLLGPALVPLGSYYPQQVPYDVEDLPLGYDLGLGIFDVLPRYHNGYSLVVGSDYFVTATGNLLDDQGQPLNLRSGRAVSLDDPEAPSPEVITNRVGRFAVSGLAAGRWRLTFQGSPALTYDIVVPADTLFRAGTLSPSGSGE